MNNENNSEEENMDDIEFDLNNQQVITNNLHNNHPKALNLNINTNLNNNELMKMFQEPKSLQEQEQETTTTQEIINSLSTIKTTKVYKTILKNSNNSNNNNTNNQSKLSDLDSTMSSINSINQNQVPIRSIKCRSMCEESIDHCEQKSQPLNSIPIFIENENKRRYSATSGADLVKFNYTNTPNKNQIVISNDQSIKKNSNLKKTNFLQAPSLSLTRPRQNEKVKFSDIEFRHFPSNNNTPSSENGPEQLDMPQEQPENSIVSIVQPDLHYDQNNTPVAATVVVTATATTPIIRNSNFDYYNFSLPKTRPLSTPACEQPHYVTAHRHHTKGLRHSNTINVLDFNNINNYRHVLPINEEAINANCNYNLRNMKSDYDIKYLVNRYG